MDGTCAGLDLVRAGHDHDLPDRLALAQASEDLVEEETLLGPSEAGCGARGEDDRAYRQPFSDRQRRITRFT
jgi:hypothetical protein